MSLTLKIGCMFSGKTSEIIRIVNRLSIINKNILLINSSLDDRYVKNSICSHNKNIMKCFSLNNLDDIDINEYNKSEYIIIDEAQFFKNLYNFVKKATDRDNKHVIIVGLNGDSNRNNFGDIYKLYPLADEIELMTAMCSICKNGNKAIFSKKIIEDNNIIDIGTTDKYIPVCRKCYNL
jgi:thymidine kinase